MKKKELVWLKNIIKELVADKVKYDHYQSQRVRWHLLMYAFLRNVPYKVVEQNTLWQEYSIATKMHWTVKRSKELCKLFGEDPNAIRWRQETTIKFLEWIKGGQGYIAEQKEETKENVIVDETLHHCP